MANDTIKFSYNWNNKLENKAFTTIRIHNRKKYIPGKLFDIELNGISKGTALLKEKRTINPGQLNDFICYLDTGYNSRETLQILERMYPNMNIHSTLFDLCLLVYEKPNDKEAKPMQTSLKL